MRSGLAVLACALPATLAPAQEPAQVPTFPSHVDLVTVDAVVLDAKGDLVRGLTAEDFILFEDGRPQTIASFEAVDAPASGAASAPESPSAVATNRRAIGHTGRPFVLLVDDMSLAPSRPDEVRKAIMRFLAEGVREGDELIFATTSFCQFEVFGASRAGPVEAWVELRRREGEVVRRSTSSVITAAPDGRLVRLVALPLGLAEGEYELVVRVEERATGATCEHVEPLKLTAPGS